MANHSNPVTKNDPGLECMPQEFGAFVNLVHDALKEFRPPSGSILQLLMQNLQGFDAWRKGTRSDIHLCPFASPPTFKRKIARDIFPLITSSILVVRAHWAMDQHSPGAATDLMPLDISPHHHGDRRTVPYWSSKIPERLVALRERLPRCLEITSQSSPPGNTATTARELIDRASRLETTSQRLRMMSHIYYCAAALKQMSELGPEEFFEQCLHASNERYSFASPFIMTLLISPLVLLFDTTLTSPSILPSITAMVSHAVLHGGLRQSNGPRKVLENALFNLIFSVSRAGQISQHDLDRFHAAWTMVLPCIRAIGPDPRDVGTGSAPPFSEQVSGLHPSTAQSPAAAEISGFAPTPTVAHSPITTPSTICPQSAPNAPDDRDEEFTLGPKGPQQNSPFTQVPSSAGQKRGRGERYDRQLGNRKRARKRVTSGAGHIQEVYETEGTVASISIYSLETCKTWPHVTSVDKTLDVPELNPDARPKLLHSVDLPVIFVDEGQTSRMETFFFPYCEHSPSLQKLRHFLESPQHDSKYWKPVLMTTQQALAMDVQRFQGMVNDGTPIVLVDRLGQVPFLAHSFINFQSKVQCLDSDHIPSTDHPRILQMTAGALNEIYDWQRSRPLIFTQPTTGCWQPLEKLLNTREVALALADFPRDRVPDQSWRYPIIAAAGSIHPPHQCPSGVGTCIHCASGCAVFFIPILKEDQFIMSYFNGTDAPHNLDFSYLYEAPYRFGSFVLSPGQTVVLPPGQVYAYAALLSRDANNVFIPGCIMECWDFLAAGCMKRSCFTSWLRRNSAHQPKSEEAWNSAFKVSLMAMVSNAARAISAPHGQPIHSPDIANLFSLATMATEFIGDQPRFSEMTKSLKRYCAQRGPDSCSQFLKEFSRIKNCHEGDPEV